MTQVGQNESKPSAGQGPKLAEFDEEFEELRNQKKQLLEAEGITSTAGSIKFSVGERKLGMHLQPGDKIKAEFGGPNGQVTAGVGTVLGEIKHILVRAPDGGFRVTPVDPHAIIIRDADNVHHVAYDMAAESIREALKEREAAEKKVEEIKENIPPEVKEAIQNEVSE
jgi:hypothetical protein